MDASYNVELVSDVDQKIQTAVVVSGPTRTWTAQDPTVFNVAGGDCIIQQPNLILVGAASGRIVLNNFPNASGPGTKQYDGGKFPKGELIWNAHRR